MYAYYRYRLSYRCQMSQTTSNQQCWADIDIDMARATCYTSISPHLTDDSYNNGRWQITVTDCDNNWLGVPSCRHQVAEAGTARSSARAV